MTKPETCCCIPHRIGVVIIGLLSLTLDVGRIAAVLLYFPSITRKNLELNPDDFLQIAILSILALFCLVDLLLIYGVIKKESNYMVPWMMSVWFSWVVLIAGFIFQLAKPLDSTYHTAVSMGFFILYAGLTIGAYVVVYEHYMKLMHGPQLSRLLEKEQKPNKV